MTAREAPHILVIGAGSIGRRHAANLSALGARVVVSDPDPRRTAEIGGLEVASVVEGPADLLDYDGVVVASPTRFHAIHVRWASAAGLKMLVEKPLAMDRESIVQLRSSTDPSEIMVGYNLRCFEPVRAFVDLVRRGTCGEVLWGRAWFGSYLPSWRPTVDYRTTYSARRELGGGVLLDATHEIDLLLWMAPSQLRVVGASMRNSGLLDIDVEDTVCAIFETEEGVPFELSLDYLSRRYRRGLEVVGSDATVRLDWARRTLEVEDGDGTHPEAPTGLDWNLDRSYHLEAAIFLEWLQDGAAGVPVNGTGGEQSVLLAEAVREHARWM